MSLEFWKLGWILGLANKMWLIKIFGYYIGMRDRERRNKRKGKKKEHGGDI